MELALIVLLTGVVVVFSVLIVLILVVKLYSTIVYSVTQKSKQKKDLAVAKEKSADETVKAEPVVEIVQPDDDSVSDEVIAVIAAAVASMYGSKAPKIRSVKRSSASRSAWGNAGLLENTRPF